MTAKTHGTHHAGLTVPDLAAARAFFIDGLGFAPEPLGDTPLRHIMCRGPGGIRLEFIAA